MSYRYSDLQPGHVVEASGFTWRVVRVEPISRMFEWQILPSMLDLSPVNSPAKWSPPYTVDEWTLERDGIVRGLP